MAMSSSSMLASGSIFRTKCMKARPMSCAPMRLLRSSRSSSLRAWTDGPIIDSSMMRRSGIARPAVGSVSVR
jgi:hypothetical protein